jgi:hypothetical protein
MSRRSGSVGTPGGQLPGVTRRGGDLKPQAIKIHELVLRDLLATVARNLAADNRGGEGVLRTRHRIPLSPGCRRGIWASLRARSRTVLQTVLLRTVCKTVLLSPNPGII